MPASVADSAGVRWQHYLALRIRLGNYWSVNVTARAALFRIVSQTEFEITN